jgi:hypothetical protein
METQVLTTKLDSPDMCITKTEIFDVEFAKQLVNHPNILKEEKEKLKRMIKERVKGNELDIVYKLGKNCKHEFLGRFCSLRSLGLQNLQKDIRAALSQDYYWDIDMVNAQPTILKQYCEKNGFDCTNLKKYIDGREEMLSNLCEIMNIQRWEAKERITAILFGGSSSGMPTWFEKDFCDEIKKIQRCIWDKNYEKLKWVRNQPNHLGKGMAYILQTEERECLMAMDKSLTKHGRNMDVLMHDGGLVRKKEKEIDFPKGLLEQIEKDIFNDIGYIVKLLIKPIKTSFSKQDSDDIPIGTIIDDAFAAKKFAELCTTKIIYDSGIVWVFDQSNGIWSCDETHIQRVITNCGDKLIFKQDDKIYNYSGIVKNTKNLMIKLPDILPRNDGFMLSKSKSDIGKLLFTNGIYDFFTNTFTYEFNSEIVFKASMPRAFPTKDQEKVNFIREISFIDAFSDQGNREVLLHNLMRASIGDFRKKLCVGLGFTNSGKGMLTQLVRNAFGSYCSTFNGNSLIGAYDGAESSRKNGWISDIANSRFAFSSEIQVDEKNNISIDGNLLKSLASGGDELKVRKLYQNDQTIINKSTLFIFANDMPKISPVDDAVRDRVQVVNWSYSYVHQPKRNHEKKCNPELSNLYSQTEYGDAFFWLIVEEYQKWKSNHFKEPEVPECVLQGRDDILPIIDIEEILKEKYEFTKNPEDFIPFILIQEWLKENGVKDSITKIGRELNALGLLTKDIKKDRKTIRVRTGIREL